MLRFKVDQLAISPRDTEAALRLLSEMGAVEWVEDVVEAHGDVIGHEGSATNIAKLNFNYDLLKGGYEFEVLNYSVGPNWIENSIHKGAAPESCVTHLGMHCTEEELDQWKEFFAERGYGIAQEVHTKEHMNPAIRGKRKYHYCIFDTRGVLGFDVKFIVREML